MPRLLNLATIDILGQIILSCGGLASSEWRPEVLLYILQCTEHLPSPTMDCEWMKVEKTLLNGQELELSSHTRRQVPTLPFSNCAIMGSG